MKSHGIRTVFGSGDSVDINTSRGEEFITIQVGDDDGEFVVIALTPEEISELTDDLLSVAIRSRAINAADAVGGDQ